MTNTFWNGKFEFIIKLLRDDIPAEGKVLDKTQPMLEEWRKLQNTYYRYYNDGDAFVNKLRHMAKRMDYELVYTEESLEGLADAVFEKLLIEKINKAAEWNQLELIS